MQCNKLDYFFIFLIFILTIFCINLYGCSDNSTNPNDRVCIETTDNSCKDVEGETIFKVY